MKRKLLYLFSCLFIVGSTAFAQSAANYTFTTGTTGNFTTGLGGQTIDMATGTTTVVGAGLTNYGSSTFATGLDFWFMNGSTASRMTSFTAATNGSIGLNALVSATAAVPTTVKTLGAFNAGIGGNDMGTHTTGKVHYKVFGTAPNRVCVIEFLNMSIPRSSGTADATFQVRVYETTGVIEYVYGKMKNNGAASLTAVKVGMGSSTTSGFYSSVDITANTTSTTAITSNTVAVGDIPNLNSLTEGSRRYYRFTPPTVSAPTLTVTAPTTTSMTLGLTAPATTTGLYGYAYYYSFTPGGPYNYFTYIPAASIGSYFFTGLYPNTTYYWKVYSVSEGFLAASAEISGTTTSAPNVITSAATGNWSATTTWTGGVVPSYGDSVVIQSGHDVTVNASASITGISVAGILDFGTTTSNTLTISRGLTVNAGGVFNAFNGSTGRTVYVYGNINNSGTIDLSKPSSILYLGGNTVQSINSAGGTFVGTTGSGTPANTGIIANLYLVNAAGAVLNTPIIVNTGYYAYDGLLTTNNNLYLDNTQTYSGGTAPTAFTITRYNRPTNGFSSVPNFGSAATVNVSYPATTLGLANAISGNNEIPASGILNNLTVQISGGVTFANNITVKGTLSMTGGNINLGSNNLTLGSSTAAPGTLTYASGFINTTGTVTRWFGTTAIASLGLTTGLFPIGIETANRGFWIAGTPTTGGTVAVKYSAANGTSALTSYVENGVTYNRRTNSFWQVAAANGFAGSGLSIRMQSSNNGGVTSFADVNTSLFSTAAPGTFSAGTLANVDVQANRTGLSEVDLTNNFFLASNATQNPLPLNLISFAGSLKNNNATLNWLTATENNTDKFEIEKSTNSSTWSSMATVAAKGAASNTYQIVDANLAAGKYYYRLKMFDKDGKFTYSQIVLLDLNGKAQFVLNQNYPNPVKGTTQLSYQVNAEARIMIELLTNDGKKIATLVNQQQGIGTYNMTIDLAKYALAAGTYHYRMVAIGSDNQELFQSTKTMTVVQ